MKPPVHLLSAFITLPNSNFFCGYLDYITIHNHSGDKEGDLVNSTFIKSPETINHVLIASLPNHQSV